jgi:NAD(P)-dependent dehydrogenase (short-subunit alcohol dehydrogenase family)
MEWTQYNMCVDSVYPGLVRTTMIYGVEQQLKHHGGLPQWAAVEELNVAYVYLLSDAASHTTTLDVPANGMIGIR